MATDTVRTPTVITAVLNIPLKSKEDLSDLQYRCQFKPSQWHQYNSEALIQSKMDAEIENAETSFRNFRYNYITELMEFMHCSSVETDELIDEELKKLHESQYTRICDACDTLHLPRKQKCHCGGRVIAIERPPNSPSEGSTHNLPKYFHIGELLDFNPVNTNLSEPIMCNPNSKENMKTILDQLKPMLIDESKGRKWVFIGADGPPYTLMRRIIDEEREKYDWVVLVSGKGHLNMNQVKTLFRILDYVCGDVLGEEVLKFNTPKSYRYFFDCKDNHKAWQGLEIFLHGTTMELIHLYKLSIGTDKLPTIMGFLQWQAAIKQPTLKFVAQLTLNFALAIYVQRVGDRNNDEECSNAGRYKFYDMFYAFNHPIYREVEYNELRQKVSMPAEMNKLRKENCSFSNLDGKTIMRVEILN